MPSRHVTCSLSPLTMTSPRISTSGQTGAKKPMRTGPAWASSGHTRVFFDGMAPISTVIQTVWCVVAIWRKNQRHNVTPKHDQNGPPRGVGHYHILRAGHVLEEVVAIIHPRVQQAQYNKQDTKHDTDDKPDDTPGHGPAAQVFLRTLIRHVGPDVTERTTPGTLLGAHGLPHCLGFGLPLTWVGGRVAPLLVRRGLRSRSGIRSAIGRLPVTARSSGTTPALRRCADLPVILLSRARVPEDVICRIDPLHHCLLYTSD